MSKKLTLSPEQLDALRVFAKANGSRWKSALVSAWQTGRWSDYPGTTPGDYSLLQQVRNTFGSIWLVKFSFDKPKTHSRSAS